MNVGNNHDSTNYAQVQRALTASFLSICKRMTINMDEGVGDALKTIFILCTSFVDRKKLYENVFPGRYIDWSAFNDGINHQASSKGGNNKLNRNILGDSSIWLRVMDFVDFGDLKISEIVLQKQYPPLWNIYNTLKQCQCLQTGVSSQRPVFGVIPKSGFSEQTNASGNSASSTSPTNVNPSQGRMFFFDDACKLCILNNIEGLISRHVTDQYTSKILAKNTFIVSSNILATLADQRISSDTYLDTIQYLLGLMKINESEFCNHIVHYRMSVQSQKQAQTQKMEQNRQISRPSMRAVAAEKNRRILYSERAPQSAAASSCSTSVSCTHLKPPAGLDMVDFNTYCDAVRFPISLGRVTRIRCYLLASMGHVFDYTLNSSMLVSSDVSSSINNHQIIFPDPEILSDAIESLTMNMAPFDEINKFRDECFKSFAVEQKRGLNMTQILQLYVSAYQKKDIWKICWKRVLPIMSPQISKDIEIFVKENPFAVIQFMQILRSSTQFVL